MNYIEEAINCSLVSDRLFFEEILEQVNIERDFMLACLENNIILEADTLSEEKKGNWLQTIINTIKRIFDKFIENVQNLFKTNQAWINKNIGKLPNLNYDGLTVNVVPYWKVSTTDIINTLNNLQKEINNVKPNDNRLKNLQTKEDVEQFGAFKKFVKRNGTFTDGIKAFLKTGETNEPKPQELSGDALKRMAVTEMGKYVVEYNTTLLPQLKSSYNNFKNMLNNVERQLKRSKPVGESFCIIENAYYSDTELALCENYDILFEAGGKNKVEDSNKPTLNKVEDTSTSNTDTSTGQNEKAVTKDTDTEYYTYIKNAIQLNQIAVAAALTACEERYRSYMTILRGIISARGK